MYSEKAKELEEAKRVRGWLLDPWNRVFLSPDSPFVIRYSVTEETNLRSFEWHSSMSGEELFELLRRARYHPRWEVKGVREKLETRNDEVV